MESIPQKIFVAILNREDVFFTEENQWYLGGYVFFEGKIHSFYIDRKDQFDRLNWSRSFQEALETKHLQRGVRPWIRRIKKREEGSRSS